MKRLDAKYLLLDGKLLKVLNNKLYFEDKELISASSGSSIPSNPNSSGTAGQIAYDNKYLYVCISNNQWVRTALAKW